MQAMRSPPSFNQPTSRRPLSPLSLGRSLKRDRAPRHEIPPTGHRDAPDRQPPSSSSKSFAMTILPVSSMESRSCRPHRKPLKISYLLIVLSPMFGGSYRQVIENGDLTIFIFSRFLSCHIHFVSTS